MLKRGKSIKDAKVLVAESGTNDGTRRKLHVKL